MNKETFEDWCKDNLSNPQHHVKGVGVFSRPLKTIWDHQQSKIDELQKKLDSAFIDNMKKESDF